MSDNSAFRRKKVLMNNNENISAVTKGLEYEDRVVRALQSWGLDAHRTNTTNPDDPEESKHGFDGGVDIIARYSVDSKVKKDLTFYIQCKDHKKELTKSAVSEVYAGMHARKAVNRLSYAVVVTTATASQETIQYAKALGVELITAREKDILKFVAQSKHASYDHYGPLMKIIIYNYTKDPIWIDTLPENGNPLSDVAMKEKLLKQTEADFDSAQADLDSADNYERKAKEARQRALDKQKIAAMRAIQASGLKGCKESKADKPDDDSG